MFVRQQLYSYSWLHLDLALSLLSSAPEVRPGEEVNPEYFLCKATSAMPEPLMERVMAVYRPGSLRVIKLAWNSCMGEHGIEWDRMGISTDMRKNC